MKDKFPKHQIIFVFHAEGANKNEGEDYAIINKGILRKGAVQINYGCNSGFFDSSQGVVYGNIDQYNYGNC